MGVNNFRSELRLHISKEHDAFPWREKTENIYTN
jgi:hypothetical protein